MSLRVRASCPPLLCVRSFLALQSFVDWAIVTSKSASSSRSAEMETHVPTRRDVGKNVVLRG